MSKKQEKKIKVPAEPKEKVESVDEDFAEQGDFGGLPDRNLKRNLGCG